jgi:hypothetical protein
MTMPADVTFRPFVITDSNGDGFGMKILQPPEREGGKPTYVNDNLVIPMDRILGMSLANRTVDGVTSHPVGERKIPWKVNFSVMLDKLGAGVVLEGGGKTLRGELEDCFQRFVREFLPSLKAAGKYEQAVAELENLEHIKSCVDEMLKPIADGGLGFRPEFVARVVLNELNFVMFQPKPHDPSDDKEYKPSCMFDFGPARAHVELGPAGDYVSDGRGRSPSPPDGHGCPFSFLRGDVGKSGSSSYVMPDEKPTICLQGRNIQYARELCDDPAWSSFGPHTDFMKLPPAMMFLVGLQYGQINVGTWNPFTLAAKRYFALQTSIPADGDPFFWREQEGEEETNPFLSPLLSHSSASSSSSSSSSPPVHTTGSHTLPSGLLNDVALQVAFGPIFSALKLPWKVETARQFETALCAIYYPTCKETLSRVSFAGNDRTNCRIEDVYRLERLEAMEPIGLATTADGGMTYAANPDGVSAHSKRSVLVSTSATMFVRSLDKMVAFPLPIGIISRHKRVSHACVLGTHLTNFDYPEADRPLPECLLGELGKTSYTEGCPFYKDPQREFLLMPVGRRASVEGVLAVAPQDGVCFVLASGGSNFHGGKAVEEGFGKADLGGVLVKKGVRKQVHGLLWNQLRFCRGEDVRAETIFAGIHWFEKLEPAEKLAKSEELEKYRKQLKSIVDGFGFKTLFQIS